MDVRSRVEEMQVEALLLGDASACSGAASCRICFESRVAPGDDLLSPCRCKGTMKVGGVWPSGLTQYVHASCLNEWRRVSRRLHSVMACDQCGAAYRFRASLLMRALMSPALVLAAAVFLYAGIALAAGAGTHKLLQRYQPELFADLHPVYVQSCAFRAPAPTVTLSVSGSRSAASLLWDALLGASYAGDDASSLGVFQPAVLIQLSQGLFERLLEGAWWRCALFPARGVVLRLVSTASLSGELGAIRMAVPAVPLPWRDTLLWWLSLGLAVVGIVTMLNMLIGMSMLRSLFTVAPFAIVDLQRLDRWSNEAHVRLVWETTGIKGLFLLAFVLWGNMRVFSFLWAALARTAQLLLAQLHPVLVDYDTDGAWAPPPPPRSAERGVAWGLLTWFAESVTRAAEPPHGLHDLRWTWAIPHMGD